MVSPNVDTRRLLLLVALLFTIGSSCAFPQPVSVEDIIERASPAVVKIVVYDITGAKRAEASGFFIGPGRIVTNAHVVEDAYSAEVHGSVKSYERVTIAKRNDDVDLALLTVMDAGEPMLRLADTDDLRPGQRVLAIGNPLGLDRTVSDGLISAVRGIPGELQLVQISAPISPGSSGGPLLDLRGLVIGVTSAGLSGGQNLNFAVGIETLRRFLRQPEAPELLEKARSRVLWRTVLKWIVNVVLGLMALAFWEERWPIVVAVLALG